MSNSTYDAARHLRRLFRWACFALVSMMTAVLLNEFRTPPPIAPYNIGFNWGVLLPLFFLSALISYFVLGHTLLGWRKMHNLKLKAFNFFVSVFIFSYIIFWFFG